MTKVRAGELEVVGDLARALVTTIRLDELLAEIAAAVGRILGYPDCVLYLWDEDDQTLTQRAAHGSKWIGEQREILNPLRLTLDEGIVGDVGRTRQPSLVHDVSQDPRYVPDLEPCASEITVAIVFHDGLVGVIDAESPVEGAFSESDLEILARFADLCAPAIVNAQRLETERRETRFLLERSQTEWREIVENTSDVVYRLDGNAVITYINPSGCRLFGRDADDLLGRPIVEFVPHHSRERFLGQLELLQREGRHLSTVDLPIIRPSGALHLTEQTLTRAIRDGKLAGFHAIARDVSERRELEEKLTRLANHDPVTELFNRRRFEQELESELLILDGTRSQMAVLWLDIDRFKDLNDSRGHSAGDELLVQLANLLRELLRSDDVIARIGGDEFAVLLKHADRVDAERTAHRVVAAIAGHSFLIAGAAIRTTASVGIALLPEHGTTVEEALVNSDLAMYAAKDSGRNTSHVYAPDDAQRQEIQVRLSVSEKIREALQNDSFELHAQPIVHLESGEIHSYELLLRLPDGRRTLLPGALIGVAERIGLIAEIDRWVVRQCLALQIELGPASPTLEVNLSSKTIGDRQLLDLLKEAVNSGDIRPQKIVFEITETAAVADLLKARIFIESLQEMGFRFAIDDFGVGFSSFYYLKRLPIDLLKIDGSFVRELATDPVDQHLVRSMVEMARGLDQTTIAECVENETCRKLLLDFGVDYAQGFHIGRPGPVREQLGLSAGERGSATDSCRSSALE